ncbi:Conserved_hypothetical protein [Hexamita inflata]|uniref:Uncharacterized protein n=1 Tax=Hexamita inflata TaxID=28002 RepID=A0AA86PKL7_9EUKA|nr:Conserved hypothetical protein [Hexamita inflata]
MQSQQTGDFNQVEQQGLARPENYIDQPPQAKPIENDEINLAEIVPISQQFDKLEPKKALITHIIPQLIEQLIYSWSVITQAYMLVSKLGTDYYVGFVKEFSLQQIIVTQLPIAYGITWSISYLGELLKEISQDNTIIVPFMYSQLALGVLQMILAAVSSQLTTLTKTGFIIKVVFSFLKLITSFGYFLRAQQLKIFALVRGAMIWLFIYFGVQYTYTFNGVETTTAEGVVYLLAHLFITFSVLIAIWKQKFASTALVFQFTFKKEDFLPNKEMIKTILMSYFKGAQMYIPLMAQYVVYILVVNKISFFSTPALQLQASANIFVFVVYNELIKAVSMVSMNAFVAVAPGLLKMNKMPLFKEALIWCFIFGFVLTAIIGGAGFLAPKALLSVFIPANKFDQTQLESTIKYLGLVGIFSVFQTMPAVIMVAFDEQLVQPIQGIAKIVAAMIVLTLQQTELDQAKYEQALLSGEIAGCAAGLFTFMLVILKVFWELREKKGKGKKKQRRTLTAEEILGK